MHAAAAAWFVAVAVLVSYPLIRSIDTAIPGVGPGDNLTFLWNSWWARHLLSGGSLLQYFQTNYLFAPFGAPLVLNTHTALESFAAASIPGVPIVRAHNLVLLAGLAANGFVTYLLALSFTRRSVAAIVAGTAFATCSYLSVHLLGHVNLTHAWVLPLAALAWTSFVRAPSAGRASGAAVAFAAAAWSDYYYVVYSALLALAWLALSAWTIDVEWPVSRHRALERSLLTVAGVAAAIGAAIWLTGGIAFDLAGRHVTALSARNPSSIAGICLLLSAILRTRPVVSRDPKAPSWRAIVRYGSAGLLIFGVLTAPIVAAAIELIRSGGYVSQQYFWRSAPRGVDVATLILGPPMHAVSGSVTSAVDLELGIDRIEQTAWLGIVSSVLVIVAVRSRAALGRDASRWLWICALFAVWSLGPSLSIAGADTGVFLPQALARYVPIVSNARVPGRAFVVVQLAAALLAAIVVTHRKWRPAPLVLLMGAVVLESLAAPFPLYQLPAADAVDGRLAETDGAVVELPSGLRDGFGQWGRFDARALAHQLHHARPIVGGFAARLSPAVTAAYRANPTLSALVELSSGGVAPASLPADLGPSLARLGIFHVVVNTDSLGDVREPFETRGLHLVAEDGVRKLYAVRR